MFREDVYKLIDEEREYQQHWDLQRYTEYRALADGQGVSDLTRGTLLLDSNKPIESWILWMEEYLQKARQAAAGTLDQKKALENIRKVAALAVACMEYNETPPREKAEGGSQ